MPVRPTMPSVVGTEGVGHVLAVGPGVEHLAVGDLVVPPLYSFTWRERMVVLAQDLFALPPNADLQQLAMLRVNPAALIMSEYVSLQPGDWIIQNAANSGVGRSAIALAQKRGFRTINFVQRPELIAQLEESGGDLVLLEDEHAADRIAAVVGRGRIALAMDGVSRPATARLSHYLSQKGVLVGYALEQDDVKRS
jgi:NADPH:quinone reductase-like Zn-dependent oxidoreductase